MSRDMDERERLRALTDGGHTGIGEVAIVSEKNRRDAACGAEFVVGNSNRRPPGQRPGARLTGPLKSPANEMVVLREVPS